MPILPPELTDQIVHYLEGDLLALSACRLVGRDWVPAASVLLFARLSIRPHMSSTLFHILFDTDSGIAFYARFLQIDAKSDVRWANIHLPRLGPFPSLRELVLDLGSWNDLSSEVKRTLGQLNSKVLVMKIYGLVHWPLQGLHALIVGAPSLQQLHIDYDWFNTYSGAPDSDLANSLPDIPAKLQQLQLHTHPRLAQIYRCIPARNIKALSLIPHRDIDLDEYLQTIGPSLEHLRLHITRQNAGVSGFPFYDIY